MSTSGRGEKGVVAGRGGPSVCTLKIVDFCLVFILQRSMGNISPWTTGKGPKSSLAEDVGEFYQIFTQSRRVASSC